MLAYNRAGFIGEAIQSVLAQTYTNWELVIIDDGSTDNTSTVVSGFTDSRIRHIKHTDNRGLRIRRQESLTHAQGKFLAVLDSDDVWIVSSKLDKQVAYLEANPECSVVGTFTVLLDVLGKNYAEVTYPTDDANIRRHLLYKSQFTHSSVLMRTAAVQKTFGYRFPIAEDFDLFLQLGQTGTLANLPEVMTGYRVHPGSETSHRKAMFESALAIIKIHRDNYPNFYCGYVKFLMLKQLSRFT